MIEGMADRLKALRMKYGYSQKQVADRIDISPSIVSGYETGERTPSTEVLLSLAYLYNVSTDYLLGKQPISPGTVVSLDGLTNQQVAAIAALVESMKNASE